MQGGGVCGSGAMDWKETAVQEHLVEGIFCRFFSF
jgi:hypothetical protein